VDANQVVVSPRIMGRIERLAASEGDDVQAGQTIAVLDSMELTADRQAAEAVLASLRSHDAQTRAHEESTAGEPSNAALSCRARAGGAVPPSAKAEADLQGSDSDTRRALARAKEGAAPQQQVDKAEAQLNAHQAVVRAAEDQTHAAQADLDSAVARTHQANAA